MRQKTSEIVDAGPPAHILNPEGLSPVVLICEHASRHIPACLGSLGLSEAERMSHIAWDIGAEGVSRKLSVLLDAPLVLQRYSRLVYDCNRPPQSPGAMPVMSETTAIAGNQDLSDADRVERVEQIYKPFHSSVSELLDRRQANGIDPVFATVHSFTPVFKGQPREVELGILHDEDSRLADIVIAIAGRSTDYETRRNEPYGPEDGVTHTLNLHGGERGLLHVMIEIRNDLVANEQGEAVWAERLRRLLSEAIAVKDR